MTARRVVAGLAVLLALVLVLWLGPRPKGPEGAPLDEPPLGPGDPFSPIPALAPPDPDRARRQQVWLRMLESGLERSHQVHPCPVDPPLQHANATIEDLDEPGARAVPVVGGRAWLPAPGGHGVLRVDGHAAVEVRWTGAEGPGVRCEPSTLALQPGVAAVTGLVAGAEGAPEGRFWVLGCGGLVPVDEDGGFYLEAVPGPCAVRALRQDGAQVFEGPPVEVVPGAGEERVVDLALEEDDQGSSAAPPRTATHEP